MKTSTCDIQPPNHDLGSPFIIINIANGVAQMVTTDLSSCAPSTMAMSISATSKKVGLQLHHGRSDSGVILTVLLAGEMQWADLLDRSAMN
ncbi:hypothetical protein TorRG33x02_074490 [Trema orientale]|uniref:Uncharacterized protein n=1 Tax=Trema orientale TaxID=63057 RepID=A0A2P5FG15_TREOI|nr:hypothetical protein TorRG33x02_074490 [Trema orientale]